MPWRIDGVEWQGGANLSAAEISRANRKSKGQGVTLLGFLSTASRVIAGHYLMVPDSCWPCRTHWESCEISPEQQRSEVKFSFSIFLFPACSAPCCNFDEDFICRHDSVIFCCILIQALLLICAEVICIFSLLQKTACFLAGVLSVASLSNIPCIELQLSLLWVGFLQLSAEDVPLIFSCFFSPPCGGRVHCTSAADFLFCSLQAAVQKAQGESDLSVATVCPGHGFCCLFVTRISSSW